MVEVLGGSIISNSIMILKKLDGIFLTVTDDAAPRRKGDNVMKTKPSKYETGEWARSEAKQERHTPVPWKVDGNRIIQTFIDKSWNNQVPASKEDVVIGTFDSCDQAEQAATAVNAHEELVQTLKFLLGNHSGIRKDQPGWNFDKMEILAIEQALSRSGGR